MNKFSNTNTPASGANDCKRVNLPNRPPILLSIWDTAGQEKYMAITKIFYKGANGIILIFDVTSRASFNRVEEFWLKEFKNEFDMTRCVITLVGNKIDKPDRAVSTEEGQELAQKHGMIYRETSALQDLGMKEAIECALEKIMILQKPSDPSY